MALFVFYNKVSLSQGLTRDNTWQVHAQFTLVYKVAGCSYERGWNSIEFNDRSIGIMAVVRYIVDVHKRGFTILYYIILYSVLYCTVLYHTVPFR